jgi:hypothetical protein
MQYNIILTSVFIFHSLSVLASKEECEALRKEDADINKNLLALSKVDKDFANMINPDTPKDLKPFIDNSKISSIPINKILKDLSGGYCESAPRIPIMYFGGGTITVTYAGFWKE